MKRDLEESFTHPGMQAIGEVHPTSYQHEYPITGRDYWPAWEFAEEKQLTVLIHSGPMSEYDRCAPSEIAKVAKQHPNMNVLIGHTGGYSDWELLDEACSVTKEFENLYLEICAMGRHFGSLDYMVAKVGAERIVFGTDAPFPDWHAEIANVVFSGISESEKKLIFGQNLEQLLRKSIR
jgi:predicted TIM-barrel fold metal-dependent hydrolase